MSATRVLFVCFGNICRSPMAEAMAREIGRGAIEAESAGVGAIPGNRATPDAVLAASERGFDLSGHRARFVGDLDLDSYDLIVSIDPTIIARLADRIPDDDRLVELDIEDPYGGELDDYRRCAEEIETEVRRIVESIGA